MTKRGGNNFQGFKDFYLNLKTRILTLTVLYVPCSLGSGDVLRRGVMISVAEREGNNLNFFKDFYLEAMARIWPWLSSMCHIRSDAETCYAEGSYYAGRELPAGITKHGLGFGIEVLGSGI